MHEAGVYRETFDANWGIHHSRASPPMLLRSVFLAGLAVASTAFGQIVPSPPSSVEDGVVVLEPGLNAGSGSHWDAPRGLAEYGAAVAGGWRVPTSGQADDIAGLTWSATPSTPALAAWQELDRQAGTLRVIHVASTEGARLSVGYAYDGAPAGGQSYTAFADTSPGALSALNYFDLTLALWEAHAAEVWIGVASGPPSILRGNAARWANTPLLVNTWLPALGTYEDIATHLVTFGVDDSHSPDLVLALQFFPQSLGSFVPAAAAIPEPGAVATWASLLLLILTYCRHRRRGSPQH